MALNLRAPLATIDHRYRGFTCSKKFSNISARVPAGFEQLHSLNVRVTEFLVKVFSAFFKLVVGVHFWSSEKQMKRVDAFPVVTFMQNVLAFRQRDAVSNLVRNSITPKHSPITPNASVSSFQHCSSPQVAAINASGRINFFKKPIRERSFLADGMLAFMGAACSVYSVSRWSIVFTPASYANRQESIFSHVSPQIYLV